MSVKEFHYIGINGTVTIIHLFSRIPFKLIIGIFVCSA